MSDGGGGGPSVSRYTHPFTTVCPGKLLEAVNAEPGIAPTCLQIITRASDTIFEFDAAISGAENTTLAIILFGFGSPITGAWTCPAASTGHAIDDEEINDSAAADELVIWTSNKIDTDYYNKTSLDGGQLDNRYFTETESDARFAALIHNHSASEIISGTFDNARIAESNVTQHEAAIDHDALLNFLSTEHINHSNVSITGTNSVTGGGNITTSRTVELVNDTASPGNEKVYGTNDSGVKGWYDQLGSSTLKQIVTGTVGKKCGTTKIPWDSSTPKITEGSQLWSKTFTPMDGANKVIIKSSQTLSFSCEHGNHVVIAFFRDNTCIGSGVYQQPMEGDDTGTMTLLLVDTPGTTNQVTYSVRVGKGESHGTWYVNRIKYSSNHLGGTLGKSGYTIIEVLP